MLASLRGYQFPTNRKKQATMVSTSPKTRRDKQPREVVIHAGMHKTGTTSIQRSLRTYDDGVTRYARIGPPNHSIALSTIFRKTPESYGAHVRRMRSRDEVVALRSQWLRALRDECKLEHQRLVLSGEDIGYLAIDEVEQLRNFAADLGRRAKILIYLRDPVSYANSAFQQRVKQGMTRLEVPQPRYRFRVQKFDEVFGRENVELVRYEDARALNAGNVVADFCKRCGMSAPDSDAVFSNVRLPAEAISLVLAYNLGGLRQRGTQALEAQDAALSTVCELFDTRFSLSRDLIVSSIDDADLQWIEERINHSLSPELRQKTNLGASFEDLLDMADSAADGVRQYLLDVKGISLPYSHRPAEVYDALVRSQVPG